MAEELPKPEPQADSADIPLLRIDAVVKNFNAPADAVVVTIIEAEAASKAKGGVLFSEMKR